MTAKASVFRTEESLRSVLATIAGLKSRYQHTSVSDKGAAFNYELTEAVELGYLLELAESLAVAALARTESRGAHFRDDHPLRDDANWMRHTLVSRAEDGTIELSYRPVEAGRYLPTERKY
jgi:succinate dehydrogenase / fumarate reductase flavoprotein subunit